MPWPDEPASGRPKVEDVALFDHQLREERLLELAQLEAQCQRPLRLLSRAPGGVKEVTRLAARRDARRARLDAASERVVRAVATLEALGDTLWLRGEEYMDKMKHDEYELVDALVAQLKAKDASDMALADPFAPKGTAALATTAAPAMAWATQPNTASAWQGHLQPGAAAAAAAAPGAEAPSTPRPATSSSAAAVPTLRPVAGRVATPAPPPPPPPPPPAAPVPASLHGRLATLRDADAHRSLEKDLRKARDATCFIGRGKAGSATEKYRVAAGDLANKARYSPLDRVFVSVNGQTAGRVALLQNGALSAAYRLLEAATAKGVTIVADNLQDRSRGYNLGEQELAHWLTRIARPRYHEVTVGSGVWTPADDAPPPPKRPRPTPPPAPAPAPVAPEPVDPGAWTCFCTSVNKAEAMECWVCGLRRP